MVNYYVRTKATSSGLAIVNRPPKRALAFVRETRAALDNGVMHHLAHIITSNGNEQCLTVITYTGQDRAKLRNTILKMLS